MTILRCTTLDYCLSGLTIEKEYLLYEKSRCSFKDVYNTIAIIDDSGEARLHDKKSFICYDIGEGI